MPCSGETNSASLQAIGEHDNVLDLVLPYHPPEIRDCVWHGTWGEREREREKGEVICTLSSDIGLFVVITLRVRKKQLH